MAPGMNLEELGIIFAKNSDGSDEEA